MSGENRNGGGFAAAVLSYRNGSLILTIEARLE